MFHQVEYMALSGLKYRMEKFGQAANIRSLERGIQLMRAFRPGSSTLSNAELADRLNLAKSTVSRLTQTLVNAGFLQFNTQQRSYQLGTAVLSLSHAMRGGSSILKCTLPLMQQCAQTHKINVGLATQDAYEMVYLESVRYHPRATFRTVQSGQRVPLHSTSLGKAYLASLSQSDRDDCLEWLSLNCDLKVSVLTKEMGLAISDINTLGFCWASWQTEVVAVACSIEHQGLIYALNASVSSALPVSHVVSELGPKLLELKHAIKRRLMTSD